MIFPAFAKVFSTIVGFVIGAVIGLFVIYSNILDEEIGDFCVTLQPNEEVSTSDHAAAAPGIEAA
jgi:putative Mn2+ efflux pump MntP